MAINSKNSDLDFLVVVPDGTNRNRVARRGCCWGICAFTFSSAWLLVRVVTMPKYMAVCSEAERKNDNETEE